MSNQSHRRTGAGSNHWLAVPVLILASTLAQAGPALYSVTAPDGASIAVQEQGNRNGQAIIFVHGLLGSHLNWEAQVSSRKLDRYRLITYDLRGHGSSDKPEQTQAYTNGRHWADDLAAVNAASGAARPVLVGWSLGAAVITNYLAAYGDQHIGGAVYVGGVIEISPDLLIQHADVNRGLASADLKTHLDAERAFLQLCFNRPPATAIFQRLLAAAALASRHMQIAVKKMTLDAAGGLGKMQKPLLLIYGEQDALVQASPSLIRATALHPKAQSIIYATAGHSPFMEEPERFNSDLAQFVLGVTKK